VLEGKTVNLRVVEKDDIEFVAECLNDIDFLGEYIPLYEQRSKSEFVKQFDNPSNWVVLTERKDFVIQKKDGAKVGIIGHWFTKPSRMMEIGFNVVPNERGRRYGSEAVQLMVDYLFLLRDIPRIQAVTDVRNKASQKVLEKADFKIEGAIRKCYFVRGQWKDSYLYSILREEWKEPRMLTKTS
jgi:RimJ/RimL family protein N-acetyltransferase